MSLRPPLLALAALAVAVLFPSPVVAQTVSVQTADRYPRRNENEQPFSINFTDCMNDAYYTFPVRLTNPGNLKLEVWASFKIDCSSDATRNNLTNPQCWKVYEDSSPVSETIDVRMRNIIYALGQKRHATDTTITDCSLCNDSIASDTFSSPQAFSLTFVMVQGGDLLPVGASWSIWPRTTQNIQVNVDLVGPNAPVLKSAGTGETLLVLDWTAERSKDTIGYRFFCDPRPASATSVAAQACLQRTPGNSGGAGGATTVVVGGAGGAAGAAGAGAGGASGAGTGGSTSTGGSTGTAGGNAACPSSALVPGRVPDPSYECGSKLGTIASEGNAEGLTNGINYAVAVAAVDTTGNVGQLSNIECGVPQDITDFFEAYRQAGGKGGGGFCSFSPTRETRFGGAGLIAAVAALWMRRRRHG